MTTLNTKEALDYVASLWEEFYRMDELEINGETVERHRARACASLKVLEKLTGKELYYNTTKKAIKEI